MKGTGGHPDVSATARNRGLVLGVVTLFLILLADYLFKTWLVLLATALVLVGVDLTVAFYLSKKGP